MPHVLHTIWLDSHEPTNKDTLWIKPISTIKNNVI